MEYEFYKAIRKKNAAIFSEPAPTAAFLGDSVTQGCFQLYQTGEATLETTYDYTNCCASHLRAMLADLYPKVQINLINAGISGDTAPGGSARLDRDIFPYHPHLLVVSYGLNDCGHGRDGIPAYRNALRRIFTRVREAGIQTVFMTPNMLCTYVSYDNPSDFFKNIAGNFANLQNTGVMDAYVDTARQVCAEEQIPVCDIYRRWKQLFCDGADITRLLANRINHPVPAMNRMAAGLLADMLLTGKDCV